MNVTLRDVADLSRLTRLVRDSADARQRDWYRVVLLAALGQAGVDLQREQIASIAGRMRSFVDTWVKRYRTGGIGQLRAIQQKGRKPFLDEAQQPELAEALDAGPQPGVDPRTVFFGGDIRQLIRRHFGKLHGVSGVNALLDRLEFSWLCPSSPW